MKMKRNALGLNETLSILRAVMQIDAEHLKLMAHQGKWLFADCVLAKETNSKEDWFRAYPVKLDGFLRECFGVSLEEAEAARKAQGKV